MKIVRSVMKFFRLITVSLLTTQVSSQTGCVDIWCDSECDCQPLYCELYEECTPHCCNVVVGEICDYCCSLTSCGYNCDCRDDVDYRCNVDDCGEECEPVYGYDADVCGTECENCPYVCDTSCPPTDEPTRSPTKNPTREPTKEPKEDPPPTPKPTPREDPPPTDEPTRSPTTSAPAPTVDTGEDTTGREAFKELSLGYNEEEKVVTFEYVLKDTDTVLTVSYSGDQVEQDGDVVTYGSDCEEAPDDLVLPVFIEFLDGEVDWPGEEVESANFTWSDTCDEEDTRKLRQQFRGGRMLGDSGRTQGYIVRKAEGREDPPTNPPSTPPVDSASTNGDDSCDNAVGPLVMGTITAGSTMGAAADAVPACGGSSAGTFSGVWYTVLGTGGMIEASTCTGTELDTGYENQISVWQGACDSLQCVAGSSTSATCNSESSITWPTLSGQLYYVLVHGTTSTPGTFGIAVKATNDGVTAGGSGTEGYPQSFVIWALFLGSLIRILYA